MLAAALAAVLAGVARAEEVVLRSGTRYDATNVVLLPGDAPGTGRVRFSFAIGAGRGTVELPYERLEPANLYGLAIARTDAKDPKGQLALAQFARDRGLLGEAEARYRRAATMDPALAPDRDAGLAAIATQRAEAALLAAEAEVKRGRSDLALPRIQEVSRRRPRARPRGARPPRARVQGRRARPRAPRRRGRRAHRPRRRTRPPRCSRRRSYAPTRPSTAPRRSAPGSPTRTSRPRRRRRPSRPRRRGCARRGGSSRSRCRWAGERAEVEARDREAFALLVATDLDLAELHRQGRRFDRARDYLRAAQVLDPENPRIKETHDRIEQDPCARRRREPDPSPYWYGPTYPYAYPYPTYRAPTYGGVRTSTYFRGRWNGFRVVFGW